MGFAVPAEEALFLEDILSKEAAPVPVRSDESPHDVELQGHLAAALLEQQGIGACPGTLASMLCVCTMNSKCWLFALPPSITSQLLPCLVCAALPSNACWNLSLWLQTYMEHAE